METTSIDHDENTKLDFEAVKAICRCCVTSKTKMFNVIYFASYFKELADINVSESDGLPQYICYECSSFLEKAVKFKYKMLRAHTMLYEYLMRCAPFPIDGQDEELTKYASPNLYSTAVLNIDVSGKARGSQVFVHEKQYQPSGLDSVEIPTLDKLENELNTDIVKEEDHTFSDYEDNITLEEFRSVANKITEDDLASILRESEQVEVKEEQQVKKKKKTKKKDTKEKKKNISKDDENEETPSKSIRKPVEIDPKKIRVIMLNPQEQMKQREEEAAAGVKFPFQCNLCYKGFNFESKLQNHMAKHSPSRGPYKCQICKMHLPTNYSFSVHWLIHTRRYECVQCNRRMIDRASILDHYRSQHEGLLSLYTCNICGKVSSNNKTHRGHMRNHHSGDRPKCDQCGKTFINKDALIEHQQIHQGIKHYSCEECGQKFRTRAQIKQHQLKHTDVKEFYCVECDVRFKSSHSLRQHLKKSLKHKDHQTLKYACGECGKRYECGRQLERHALVQHLGARPHACAECGAALASRASLAKHTRHVHRGDRPQPRHVCDTCGKAFHGKSVLVNHVRTHTGEKPFPCSECGRAFSQRTARNTHVKLVHLKIKRQNKVKVEVPPAIIPSPKQEFLKPEPAVEPAMEPWRNTHTDSADIMYFRVTAGP